MSHFTNQTSQAGGPRLHAAVAVSDPRRKALEEAGKAVPNSVPVQALVDTGASCTCVDPSVLEKLGLQPTGSVQVHTPSSGSNPDQHDQFDIGLLIPGSDRSHLPLHLDAVSVVAAELLANQGFEVLIGRDILSDCILIYNGPVGVFTMAF